MRRCQDVYLFPGAFAPILSLDELHEAVESGSDDTSLDLTDREPLAEEQVERKEVLRAVNSFVASLSARDQEIVRRVFWGEASQTAVAARFNVSKMAISKAIARICLRGRDTLAAYEYLAR